MDEIRIAILAGGESSRMGRDKARLQYQGMRFLERIAGEARRVGPTAVVGRADAESFDLGEVSFVRDREPSLGPVGGLWTALEHFGRPVVLLGCDMPLVDAETIRWLCDEFAETDAPGLIAETEEGLQPLFGVYTLAVQPFVEEGLEQGERSLHRLVERAGIPAVEPPTWIRERLINVNTPEELRTLRQECTLE